MERFEFKTRFKRNKKWDINEIMKIINRNKIEYVSMYDTPYGNTNLIVSCDEKTYYDVFAKLVANKYPGVCEFDV